MKESFLLTPWTLGRSLKKKNTMNNSVPTNIAKMEQFFEVCITVEEIWMIYKRFETESGNINVVIIA